MSRPTDSLPPHLPVLRLRDEFYAALEGPKPRVILEAATGSGKSTVIPLFLLEKNLPGKILILQPRRIAARSLAEYLAEKTDRKPGATIGWRIRFESQAGPDTKVEFLTEGILLRMFRDNPTLDGIAAVVLDEFHERNLYTDLCLARLIQLQERERPDLRLVVMSATLETSSLREFLKPCAHIKGEGRSFPVEIRYVKPKFRNATPALWEDVADAFESEIIRDQREGSALVFLPGRYEITKTMSALSTRSWARRYDILPLHGELTVSQQRRAIEPGERPRIILTTNVAETSLTVDGITSVIDSGLARVARFDIRRGMDTLHVEKISRASADQRAGRAGRLAPGICVRLWDERDQASRPEASTPEIHRVDLAETVLQLASAGEKAAEFPWYQAPLPDALNRAETVLQELEAITSDGGITASGSTMAQIPLHPRLSRMLLLAAEKGAAEDAALCAALLTSRPLFPKSKRRASALSADDFAEKSDISDFQAQMRAWERIDSSGYQHELIAAAGVNGAAAREIGLTRKALLRFSAVRLAAEKSKNREEDAVWKSLLSAFPDHVAVEISPGARVFAVAHGRRAKLSAHSHMTRATLVVAAEIAEIEGKDTVVTLNGVTAVEESWLKELFPHSCHSKKTTLWDEKQKRVVGRESRFFLDLELSGKETPEVDPLMAAELLADQILLGRLETPHWNDHVEQWILRVNLLHKLMPEIGIPEFTEEDRRLVLIEMCQGAVNGRQLKDRPVFPALREWLGPALASLPDQLAPVNITLQNGRQVKLRYETNGEVTAGVILQQLYDVTETPVIAGGRKKVRMEILSPARRPIAVTTDLARFWKESYEAVRTQWRGRYPKHEWR